MRRVTAQALRRASVAGAAVALATSLSVVPISAGASQTVGASGSVHAAATYTGWAGKVVRTGGLLTGISCPTTSICYAAGGLNNSDSIIEKSTNAGASWSGPTFTATSSIGTFDAISCPDSTHCIATGGGGTVGTAYRTLDGVHWGAVKPSGVHELVDVSCVSDTICFAVSPTGTGVKTVNFGTSWTTLTYLRTTGPTAISNYGVHFLTSSTGWIVGLDTSCVSSCSGHIQGTTDGGATWNLSATSVNLPPLAGISCRSAAACVAVGSGVARTSNGGASWSVSSLPSGMDFAGSVSCPSTTVCFAAGNEHELFSSTGRFEDSTAAVARTTNGGSSWALQQVTGGLSFVSSMSCPTTSQCLGAGWTPRNAAVALTTDAGNPPGTGYYLVASDGGIFAYGNAPFHGSTGNITLNKPVVGMAVDASGGGYWMVASDGGIFAFGNAPFHGSTGNITLSKPVVGMATDPATGGYWMVASDGGIFSFDAPFFGSMGGKAISAPIVGMKAMADGSGYYLITRDGTTYAFGSAAFDTCAGKAPVPRAVAGMVPDRVLGGYWIVDSGGNMATCNHPPFFGDIAGLRLNKPIVGIAATPDGRGYWFVASDGGIFAFGDAHFLGSTGNITLNKPVVGMAAVPST